MSIENSEELHTSIMLSEMAKTRHAELTEMHKVLQDSCERASFSIDELRKMISTNEDDARVILKHFN